MAQTLDNLPAANTPQDTDLFLTQQSGLDKKQTIGALRGMIASNALLAPLTDYSGVAGTITASDTLISGINKLSGNLAAKLDSTSYSPITTPLTGYLATTGAIVTTDSILQAFNKVGGNITAVMATANAAFPAASYAPLATILIGYSSTPGTINATDTLLVALSKLNGNTNAINTQIGAASGIATLDSFSKLTASQLPSSVGISAVLTGYSSSAGVVTSTDTLLQAVNKVTGNITAVATTANAALPASSYTAGDVLSKLNTINPATVGRYVISSSGTTYPSTPGFADECYRTDLGQWFKYNGTAWVQIISGTTLNPTVLLLPSVSSTTTYACWIE